MPAPPPKSQGRFWGRREGDENSKVDVKKIYPELTLKNLLLNPANLQHLPAGRMGVITSFM